MSHWLEIFENLLKVWVKSDWFLGVVAAAIFAPLFGVVLSAITRRREVAKTRRELYRSLAEIDVSTKEYLTFASRGAHHEGPLLWRAFVILDKERWPVSYESLSTYLKSAIDARKYDPQLGLLSGEMTPSDSSPMRTYDSAGFRLRATFCVNMSLPT